MFSLDNFYNIIYANLLESATNRMVYFVRFNPDFRVEDLMLKSHCDRPDTIFVFLDQEPFSAKFLTQMIEFHKSNANYIPKIIIANSEQSQEKADSLSQYNFGDWYYFFHGFAALEWYRDYQFFPKVENQFTKVFISLNHLMTKDRSYRLNLVTNYIEQDIVSQGVVSLPLSDVNGTIKGELFDPSSKLSADAKKLILKNVYNLSEPLVADTLYPNGQMSAKLDIELQQTALWNVVSETVFYHNKLHLTEKTFKPIVARRPFILVAAPGNLAYLKSYGFKTFDRWIDESYDTIEDPDLRIQAITQELKKLCTLSESELQIMYQEMQEVLDYNFNHLYGKFKEIIVAEMLENFPDKEKINVDEVKKRWLR